MVRDLGMPARGGRVWRLTLALALVLGLVAGALGSPGVVVAAPVTTTFTNATSTAIPATGTPSGVASPYPSQIAVSGLCGTVSTVVVALNGLSHTYAADIDVLLVGPGGQSLIVMSDVYGASDSVSNLDLTIDDAAPGRFPLGGQQFTSGAYWPTNSGGGDSFPAPAPAGPYGSAAPAGSDTLASVFAGTLPNGTWSLYIVDDLASDRGTLAGGWSLTITAQECTVTTAVSGAGTYGGSATLTATVTSGGSAVPAGGQVTFTLNGQPAGSGTTDASGVATASAPLAAGTGAGSSPGAVQASYAGAGTYAPSEGTGALTVAKAPLAVRADDAARPYGAANPAFTATLSGFRNGETLATAGVTGAPALATAAAPGSPPGAYAITIAPGTLAAANYTFGPFTNGTLTVTQADQTIAFPQPPDARYGDPPFTASATATSGLPVTFGAGPASVCTASGPSGSTITLVGPGACTITASQAGNANYQPAADVSRTVGVAPCDGKFTDVAASDPACPAIAALASRGVITGYATTPPRFGPDDQVQRAQVAAFLVRALGWQNRPQGPRDFSDLGALTGTDLPAAVRIAANACTAQGRCVASGFGDGTFGPTKMVTKAEAIAFIARAFGLDAKYAWADQPSGPQPYNGVPAVHETAIRTYTFYAGAIPDAPTTADEWNAPASRAWVARVLYQALSTKP